MQPAAAQDSDPCLHPLTIPVVSVSLDVKEARVQRRAPSSELFRLAPPLPDGYRRIGWTQVDERVRVRPQLATGTDAYKRFCYIVEGVEVTIQLRPAIHVGNEFAKATCPSETIEYHQQRVLDLRLDFYRQLASQIERDLPRYKPLQITGTARDTRDARARVEARVREEIDTIRQGLAPDLERRILAMHDNSAIRREMKICPVEDWADATWPDPKR
ncbi:MAG: hypothetical protein VYB54_05485 [Pseudomonadota bacterium]|nr:hypothetical protein [Pseudomonadota bacterium]